MANLQEILYKVSIRSIIGPRNRTIDNLQTDSRLAGTGSLFIALKGTHTDGHQYIPAVIAAGAIAIVCEDLPAGLNENVTYIQVEDSAASAGIIAHNFYGQPSEKLKLVGVTGTNGKTTIATLLYKLFSGLGYKCGLLSTVQNQVGDLVVPATHTTPDALHLNALLKQMVDEGCTYAFMETSSHAIHQHRVAGLRYAGGIFSNITQDHLDYHKTFEEYI
ncbi:MAG TPA: Mur ligase family protein, partial [Puia sp.]